MTSRGVLRSMRPRFSDGVSVTLPAEASSFKCFCCFRVCKASRVAWLDGIWMSAPEAAPLPRTVALRQNAYGSTLSHDIDDGAARALGLGGLVGEKSWRCTGWLDNSNAHRYLHHQRTRCNNQLRYDCTHQYTHLAYPLPCSIVSSHIAPASLAPSLPHSRTQRRLSRTMQQLQKDTTMPATLLSASPEIQRQSLGAKLVGNLPKTVVQSG